MNSCFVLEESSWAEIDPNDDATHAALDNLIILLDVLREKELTILKHPDFIFAELKNGEKLYSILYENNGSIDHDKIYSLALAFERAEYADEVEFPLHDYDAFAGGSTLTSPSTCLAHAASARGRCVSPIVLSPIDNEHNPCVVLINNSTQDIFFTQTESDIKHFFRFALTKNGYDENKLEEYSSFAYPSLGWADGVWLGVKSHADIFMAKNSDVLLRHLAVLDDEGAKVFANCPGGDGAAEHLHALGVTASTENGKAKSCNESKIARTRYYQGQSHVFWWHTKLMWDAGRIHFKHFASSDGAGAGHIAIGLFIDHAHLPGK